MERSLLSIEGNRQKLDGGAMFGNAPRALWARWAEPDDQNRIDLACRALLVREPGRNVLLETGVGAFFPPQLKDRYGVQEDEHVLLASLAAHGLSDADIDVVVLSHLHFDHAGGLLAAYVADAEPSLLFPNARFVIGREAWARAESPHPRDRVSFIPELLPLLSATERVELVNEPGGSTTLGDGYRLHFSHGHTPGLMLTEVATSAGPIVFASDLIPGKAWVHHALTMGYDRYPELLLDEKTALLDDLIARGGRLFFTHDADHAVARPTKNDRGRYGCEDAQASL